MSHRPNKSAQPMPGDRLAEIERQWPGMAGLIVRLKAMKAVERIRECGCPWTGVGALCRSAVITPSTI